MGAANDRISEPVDPKIYAYTTAEYATTQWQDGSGFGLLKVGYTTRTNAEDRISEQFGVLQPVAKPWRLELVASATSVDGVFTDKAVHKVLRQMGRRQISVADETGHRKTSEWFECTAADVNAAIKQLQTGEAFIPDRVDDFRMRPEQKAAVEQTTTYFRRAGAETPGRPPRFLWNAKMRFGKTFASYELAQAMGWTKILVLTYKPAVQSAWEDDLKSHVDFVGWQFIGKGQTFQDIDPDRPYVWFASFQDVLGSPKDGGIKERLEAMNSTEWDCVVLDEYHFGAWRDTAKEIYDAEPTELDDEEVFDEEVFEQRLRVKVAHYLYLSGTPFRSLASGEFTEDQIFSWTYSDEQYAKASWNGNPYQNPYRELPNMVLMTYQLPEELRKVIHEQGTDEFDLNEFFKANTQAIDGKEVSVFKYEDEVQKWLNLIRGAVRAYDASLAGTGVTQPPIPFEDVRLLATLRHTFWFLPSVAACKAMHELLAMPQNTFYHDYQVKVAAGPAAGIGLAALPPVQEAITKDGLRTKTITLSCGKLTTGVSVPEWSGLFMLRNTTSPETYFQTAFRVQTPWAKKIIDPEQGITREVLKPTCYVFDFAPNRALRLLADYAVQLAKPTQGSRIEDQVADLLNFLPVLCFDGYTMEELDAGPLLDFVATGTASTMLARRWQSARLVNVSTSALARLAEHPDLMERLANLESFRNLRNLSAEVVRTISSEKSLNKVRSKDEQDRTSNEKKHLTEEERKNKGFRKQLVENLIKFAARIPIFMYLTDHREESLSDVITGIEPDLFEKVTNLTVSDFKLLCELGILNAAEMDESVFAFRRFEIASLNYAGGGTDTQAYGGFAGATRTREEIAG
jgi:hypothetical protein